MNVSKQQGGVDCGLFAIAYATTLLNGMDPVNVVFTQARMRQHVIAALEAGTLSEFPVSCRRTVRRMSVRAIPVPVYCVCKAAYVCGDSADPFDGSYFAVYKDTPVRGSTDPPIASTFDGSAR